MGQSFVHLHNHTEFSMLDGAAPVEEMVLAAKADGQTAIGITDHGNMYGVVDFYDACRTHGLNPIIGLEAYMSATSRWDRPARRGKIDDTGGEVEGGQKLYHHLTLLCENNEGYDNLRHLASLAYLEGYYYKPRVDFELLEKYSAGLMATSGCLGGVVLQELQNNNYQKAIEYAARFQSIFGRDNFFIELQDHGMPEQRRTNPQLLQIAKDLQAPLLATNDLHYVNHSDAEMHDAFLCIQTGSRLSDPDRFRFSSDQHYLKSAAEMRALFSEVPEACDNTLWIAERANVEIQFGNDALPQFPIPEQFRGGTHADEADRYLRHLTYEGAAARYGTHLSREIEERLDYELRTVAEMGFSDYFLVVWDLIRHARDVDIRVGPGRGSAAGCCIAYCLRIVEIDPIANGLIFERFLNPGRKQMPDIDMDFDERFRGDMIKYAADRYGADHVAQIVTFSTIKARAAVRDAARVLGFPPKLGDQIAKAMPPLVMGQDMPLKACFEKVAGYEARFSEAQDLRDLYEKDPEVRQVVDVALGFVDKRRQDGIHAAAVVITKDPVLDYVPIQRKSNPQDPTDDAPIVTQYEATVVEKLGLLKMDFLGLRNLAIIERTLDHIERKTGSRLDIDHIPLDDQQVYAMLQRGESIGIFQLESENMRQLMRRLAPTSFEDIGALVALYRPGPMKMNVHNDYADRKNGRQEVTYEHPILEEILADTSGLMIYQEDIMRVAQRVSGFTMTEADNLRKATGKKDRAILDAQRDKFVDGSEEQGFGRALGEALWAKIEPFADYAFNKSHAFAYAYVAYQNAWLKANYPVEYMAALLTSFRGDTDKTALYLNEARQMNITIDVPSINESLADFTPSLSSERTIIFGMATVRNVGEMHVGKIVEEREVNGPFTSVYDFVRRVDPVVMNKRLMESLIKAGAFDCVHVPRLGFLLKSEELVAATLDRRKDLSLGITTLFAALDGDPTENDWSGTDLPIADLEFEPSVKLNFEREMLGTFVSGHPLKDMANSLARQVDRTLVQITQAEGSDGAGYFAMVGGILTDVVVRQRRDDQRQYAKVTIEDLTGSAELMVPVNVYEKVSGFLVKDAVVLAKVRVDQRDESLSLSVREMTHLKVHSGTGELRLNLRPQDLHERYIKSLKEVLQRHPGPSAVIIDTGTAGKAFKLAPEFNVDIDLAIPDLRTVFGVGIISA